MLLSCTLLLLLCVQCGSRRIVVKHTEQHSLQESGAANALRAAHKERSEFLTGSHNRISETKHLKVGERVKKALLHQDNTANHRQFRFAWNTGSSRAPKAGTSSSSGSSASSSSSKSGTSGSSALSSSTKSSSTGSSSSSSKSGSSSASSKSGSTTKASTTKAPARATTKAPVSSSKANANAQAAASKSSVPLQHPFRQRRINFIPPPPSSEDYPFQAYTLSGGIFESAFEGTCMDLAYRSGNGYCYPPCRLVAPTLNPMDIRNLPPSKRNIFTSAAYAKPYCLRAMYTPGKPNEASPSQTMLSPDLGGCLCVDPCSLYTTCDTCTANKLAVSPFNCGWCGMQCVSGDREGPMLEGEQCISDWIYSAHRCHVKLVGDFITDRINAKNTTTRVADTTTPLLETTNGEFTLTLTIPDITLPSTAASTAAESTTTADTTTTTTTTTTLPGPNTTPDPIAAARKAVRSTTPAATKSRQGIEAASADSLMPKPSSRKAKNF